MQLSVNIPSYKRPEVLNNCLIHLSNQSSLHDVEILIGLDGPADQTPDPVVPESIQACTMVTRFPKHGHIPIRNALLQQSKGDIVLSMNDDSYASPDLIATHIAMHKQGSRVVAGKSTWNKVQSPTMFDRFIQESDLLFFEQNEITNPVKTHFRNCFGLNMSFPKKLAVESGGFPEMMNCYGHEDIELAYRLEQAGADIWYQPKACVVHDHRYFPADVLRREYLLGRASRSYAEYNPEFAFDLLKQDLLDPEIISYFVQNLKLEQRDAIRIEQSFRALSDAPPTEHDLTNPRVLRMLEEHWVLLKRFLWRWGVVDSSYGLNPRWSLVEEMSFDNEQFLSVR
jgi:GT2 family glycosyltransferase